MQSFVGSIAKSNILKVEGQIASGEREQIKKVPTTIGSVADGSVGPRTKMAYLD